MSEIWKDVAGYEGLYQVSSMGRVMRVAPGPGTQVGRILKPQRTTNGYLQVSLWRNGKGSFKLVHRVVLEAFRGRGRGRQGNHRNGDVTDNCLANLEWATCSENHKHAFRALDREAPCGEANGNAKLTDEKVIEICELYASGDHLQRELGRMFGVSTPTICNIVNRKAWRHVSA